MSNVDRPDYFQSLKGSWSPLTPAGIDAQMRIHEAQQRQYEAMRQQERYRDWAQASATPPTKVCDQIARMANGSILILSKDGTRMVVPPAYFKDLVALAEMEMLGKLVGDEPTAIGS